MKKLVSILGAGAVLLALTGCTTAEPNTTGTPEPASIPNTQVFEQPIPEGGTVTCVWTQARQKGGLSCDWVGYYTEYGNGRVE